MYRNYIHREPEHVVTELKHLTNEYGITHIRFTDECFTLNKKVTINLCKHLERLGMTYIWITRTDCVDKDILQALHDSGCTHIFYGIESGSQRILDSMNKGTTVKKNLEAINLTHRYDINVKVLLIHGYPGETEEDRELTIKFMKAANPKLFVLSQWTDSDFFYPDSSEEWKSFGNRIKSCLRG